jgi:DNA polymerase alpha-associated DNA helicase A
MNNSMERTLAHLQRLILPDQTANNPSSHAFNLDLINVLLGIQQPTWSSSPLPTISSILNEVDDQSPGTGSSKDIEWLGENLNDSQKEAIRFCLTADHVACIHGPPGVSCNYHSTRPRADLE